MDLADKKSDWKNHYSTLYVNYYSMSINQNHITWKQPEPGNMK